MVGNFVSLNNNYTVIYDATAGANTPYGGTFSASVKAVDWQGF